MLLSLAAACPDPDLVAQRCANMCDEAVSLEALGNSCGLDRLDAALASALFSILRLGALLSRINQQMTLSLDAGRALKGRQLFRIIQQYCTVRGTGSAVVAPCIPFA